MLSIGITQQGIFMSDLSDFILSLEEKVKSLESQIQQSIMNHNALLGFMSATKEALDAANAIVNVLAPDSSISKDLNEAEKVVNVIENDIEPA